MPITRYNKNSPLEICHVDHLRLDLGPEPELEESLPPVEAVVQESPAEFAPVDVPVIDPALEAEPVAPTTPKSRKRGESQED